MCASPALQRKIQENIDCSLLAWNLIYFFSIVLLCELGKHPISCDSAAARAKKYPLSWLVADVDFHWFQQDFVQVEGSVWVDVPVGCVPWVRHTELYSSSTLPFTLAFKNVTDTLGSAGEGAWFVTKLWLSVISYNLQMARLVEMLKTSRSHSVSCVKQMRQMAVAVFIFIHIHLHFQLMFQLPSRFPLDSV